MEIAEALKVALEFLGKWKPGLRRYCEKCAQRAQVAAAGHEWTVDYDACPHGNEVPCPPLTDELAFWMLRELRNKLKASDDSRGYDQWLNLAVAMWIEADPAEAIVQAIAALAPK